jgi:hypothetical protein
VSGLMFANLLAAVAEKRVAPIKSPYEIEMNRLSTRRLKQLGDAAKRVFLVDTAEITRNRAHYRASLGLPSLPNPCAAFPVDPAVELRTFGRRMPTKMSEVGLGRPLRFFVIRRR